MLRYGPLYYEVVVLIDNMCLRLFYAYDWLFVVLLDDSVKTDLIICEASSKCDIKSLIEKEGAYHMNIIESVRKEAIYITIVFVRFQRSPWRHLNVKIICLTKILNNKLHNSLLIQRCSSQFCRINLKKISKISDDNLIFITFVMILNFLVKS